MDGAGQQHYLAGHDRLEALVHQLDADSPLVLDEDANDSLAGEKGHAAPKPGADGPRNYRSAPRLSLPGISDLKPTTFRCEAGRPAADATDQF